MRKADAKMRGFLSSSVKHKSSSNAFAFKGAVMLLAKAIVRRVRK